MIQFSDVGLSYPTPEGGSRTVFEDVSFEVEPGSFAYLIGQTGSGKSYCLTIIGPVRWKA